MFDKRFFSPLSFLPVLGSGIRDPGSGMGENQDPGSGINIPDPQHWIIMMIDLRKTVFGSGSSIFFTSERIRLRRSKSDPDFTFTSNRQ
jgi:hypothetical protein